MPNFMPQIKNLDMQSIFGVIAAIIAAVGLIGGVATSSTSQGNTPTTPSPGGEPEYVQEYRETVLEVLRREGYSVTADANRQALASAEGHSDGDVYQYDTDKFEHTVEELTPAGFMNRTKGYQLAMEENPDRNLPEGSMGEAGLGIAYDPYGHSVVVMLFER